MLLVNYHMFQSIFFLQAFEHAGDVVIPAFAMAILPMDAQANHLLQCTKIDLDAIGRIRAVDRI
jgi:hypothetical protein